MPHTLDQILPSLQAMGVWTYWIVALLVMFEAIILTGFISPGTMAVIAGGMLAQRGVIDIFDMAWFVAGGAFLGSAISFALGRLAVGGLSRRSAAAGSRHMERAADLLRRYGGFAMIIGRFLGPLSAVVPFSAAMAGMDLRRFLAWNLASALVYAIMLPAVGYFSGRVLGTLGAAAPRVMIFGTVALAVLVILWLLARRGRRALPALLEILRWLGLGISRRLGLDAAAKRHPRLSGFVAARFSTEDFTGLAATVLGVLFLYIAGAWAESVFDFVGDSGTVASDTRIAQMFYALRDPQLVAFFGWITDIGGRHGVVSMVAGASAALLILRRFDLLAGLWLSAVGNQITVTLLKGFFDRPRSELGYFAETSGSFPSGHAAASMAVWAMLFYLGWRTRLLPAGAALLGAITLAFLIGLSRIYLVEHYVSDVLNGYLVGALWLVLGIAWCEWRRHTSRAAPTAARKVAALTCVGAALAVALTFASITSNPLNTAPAPTLRVTDTPQSVLTSPGLSERTETLDGVPRQAINLIVTTRDAATLSAAMKAAGWIPAPRPSLWQLGRAVLDDLTNRPLPEPLVIPTFWQNRPSALDFAQAVPERADDTRLQARFWDSRYRTPKGATVFVGTLTREEPLEWAVSDDAAEELGHPARTALRTLAVALRKAGAIVTTHP